MMKAVFPNVFLIGVQKGGTTTLDDWLSQHPQIYCYKSLKDVHLFARYSSRGEMDKRLLQEPEPYNQQPVVLQSAVNYIYYPQMLQQIAKYSPNAKLIVILRNPVNRAYSAYAYFKKMLREKRSMEEALIYEPDESRVFSMDNNDFTYIEHGLYFKQVAECYKYFRKEQLLVLDYDDLKTGPELLLQNIFSFLSVDASFKPDLTLKNITGTIKNPLFQNVLAKKGKTKKWVVKYLVNSVISPGRKEILKQRLFEMNTSKKEAPVYSNETVQVKGQDVITNHLQSYFINDTKQLDSLLGTNFSEKWYAHAQSDLALADLGLD